MKNTYSPLYHALACATLFPLVGQNGGWVAAGRRLEAWWRVRAIELHKAGWRPVIRTGDARRDTWPIGSCPSFVVPGPPRRVCLRARVCPHCYGRLVVRRVFQAFDAWSRVSAERGVRLGLVATSTLCTAPDLAAGLSTGLTTDVRGCPTCVGGVTVTQLAPDSGPTSWRRVSLLACAGPAGERVETPEALARLVGRVFAYPPALLRSDPVVLAQALNAITAARTKSIRFHKELKKYGEETPVRVSAEGRAGGGLEQAGV